METFDNNFFITFENITTFIDWQDKLNDEIVWTWTNIKNKYGSSKLMYKFIIFRMKLINDLLKIINNNSYVGRHRLA